ncbi:MAG: polyphosphate polymerase domain-containing protein [Acidimicrobiia bacterium]
MTPAAMTMFERLAPITLDQLVAGASLQTRVDRKYVVTPDQFEALLERLSGQAQVLDIDGRRVFEYESVYFDTPALDSYLGAARRRPWRFKVRTRSYLDAERCWVEVKLRNRRGQTVKHRHEHDFAERDRIAGTSLAFVDSFPPLRPFTRQLEPALVTRYRRSTLAVGSSRATVDVDVTCATFDHRIARLDGAVVVETKSDRSACEVDRALWALHLRPTTTSKYGIGMAALHPALPSNKWHRVLDRYVSV